MNLRSSTAKAFFSLTLLLGCVGTANATPITTYDAAADFSITNLNPNGVWSYGSSPISSYAFTAYSASFTYGSGSEIIGWGAGVSFGIDNPSVFKNTTGGVYSVGTLTLSPGELAFHPGPSGELSIVRFTAPTTGIYSLAGAFRVDDTHGPLSPETAYIILNSTIPSTAPLGTTYGSSLAFGGPILLAAGDTLDFAIDNGGTYLFNTTGIAISITTPEPASITMLGLGIVGLAGYRLRRWKQATIA